MQTKRKKPLSTHGGALIAAILVVTILAGMAALILSNVLAKQHNSIQAAAWREALVSAEAGAERAMAELRTTVDDPTQAFNGWVVLKPDGTQAASQTIDRSGRWAPDYRLSMSGVLPPQPGETKQQKYSVVVDVPASLGASGRRWNQSYRIRSTGYSVVPGPARITGDKRDSTLRKLTLLRDRWTQTAATAPEASRTIEVVAQPDTVYNYGIIAEINFKMNKKTYIDGYDSRYDDTSTNGKYDALKRTANGGTIVANRWKKNSKPDPLNQVAEKFDVGKATIFGDLLIKGSLKNVKNFENVQGNKVTNFSVSTPTNTTPAWTTGVNVIDTLDGKVPSSLMATYKTAEKQAKAGGAVAQFAAKNATAAAILAAKGMELKGGADPLFPTRFKVKKIDVDKKDESLVFNNPPGASESWIELWVTDEMKVQKGGTLFISAGVHATIFVEGKVEVKETKRDPNKDPNAFSNDDNGGFILESGFAADLQLVGLERPESSKETDDEYSAKKRSGKMTISDADFTGVINAPDWDIDFKPKDWDKEDTVFGGQLYGSVLGRKVKIGNGADIHYDESLGDAGRVLSYSIAGWNEI